MEYSNFSIFRSYFYNLYSDLVGGALFINKAGTFTELSKSTFKFCSCDGDFMGDTRGHGSGGACFISCSYSDISFCSFAECQALRLGSSLFIQGLETEVTTLKCCSDSLGMIYQSENIVTAGLAIEETIPNVKQINSSNPIGSFVHGVLHYVVTKNGGSLTHSIFSIGQSNNVKSVLDFSDNTAEISISDCTFQDADCSGGAPITLPFSTASLKDSIFIRCSGIFPTLTGVMTHVSGCLYSSSMTVSSSYLANMTNNTVYSGENITNIICQELYQESRLERQKSTQIILALFIFTHQPDNLITTKKDKNGLK